MQRQPWFAGISGGLAVLLLSTAATAQLPGPAAGNGGAASGQSKLRSQLQQRTQQQIQQSIQNRAQGEVQARVQAHVQSRVEAKLHQRFQDRAAVEVEKAAKAARHAAIAVHRRAEHMQAGDNGVERTNVPEQKVRGNASLATRQEIAAQYGNDFVYADLDAEARAKLPPGFAEADAQALAAVFGNFDAFVGEVPRRERGTDTELSGEVRGRAGTSQEFGKAEKANGETERGQETHNERLGRSDMFSGEMQLRIATATRHRRAQISKMRDRAIETGNTQMLAAADQAELMLEAFAETQRQLLQSTQSVERTAEIEAGASTVIR